MNIYCPLYQQEIHSSWCFELHCQHMQNGKFGYCKALYGNIEDLRKDEQKIKITTD